MRTAWILIGSAGDYSDRSEWVVAAFSSEDAAKTHRSECQRQLGCVDWSLVASERYRSDCAGLAKSHGMTADPWALSRWNSRDGVTYDIQEVPVDPEVNRG